MTGTRPGRRLLLLLSVFLLLFSAVGCARTGSGEQSLLITEEGLCARALSDCLPDRTPITPEQAGNPFSAVSRGQPWLCLDVQAVPARAQGIGRSFQPLCLETIVFAVDRSLTDFRPQSWADLARSPAVVSCSDRPLDRRILLGAAAYGLEGPEGTAASALRLFEDLYFRELLDNREPRAVDICPDSEAIRRIRQGADLEIIVPRDGTLTYTLGVLSNEPVPVPDRDALLRAGLRLPDGTSAHPAYPDAEAYSSAVPVTDYEHFAAVTDNATRNIRRIVYHIRLYSPADGRESILFLVAAMALIMVWSAYALHRSPRPDVRRWVRLVTFLCVGWLMLTLFKYQLPNGLLSRLCWYSYYIFLTGLPLALLYIAAVVDRPFRKEPLPRWLYPFLTAAPLLVLMVFTNDFHQLVFRFDQGPNWSDHYSYGPGYYLFLVFSYTTFLLAIGLLLRKSRKSPKRSSAAGPLLTAVLMIAYNVGYITGVPLARESNLAFVFCILVIVFVESVLKSGLIPTNTHYKDLFALAGLNMQLLDKTGAAVLSAADARPLTHEQLVSIQVSPGRAIPADENTLLHSQPISGGTVVWQEDVTLLNRLQRQIEQSVQRIESANALLSNEEQVRRQKITAQVNAQLFRMLEQDIAEKTDALARAVRSLPDCDDRERQLSYITLLLCHIKRRCNLFFLAQQGSTIHATELAVYLDELSEFADCAGVRALFRCGLSGELDIRTATLCYDFYFSLLSWSVRLSGATLIGKLEEKNGGPLFSVLSSELTNTLSFSRKFRQAAEEAGARLDVRVQDDANSISLIFPEKGGRV